MTRAALGLAVVSAAGGVAGAMWAGDAVVGAVFYYALFLLGLFSPEGAPLRRALTFRRPAASQ